MPLGPVYDTEKIIREEEQDYDIPLHDGVMQPLASQTIHITPPDDDYVAPTTNPILDKQLKEFRKEFSDITRVAKKANCNPVNDVKEFSDIKKYDCETFIWKLLHQVSQSSHETEVQESYEKIVYMCSLISQEANGGLRFREVSETARFKILRDHWRKRFGNEYDESEDFKDPDGCGESKENKILGTIINKLHDEWFKGTHKDDDDL
ncbi:hypothetical protein Tco_0317582 [Tanacetum coccineum]